jgi:2-methylcitrate dehydratase PrpD
LKLGLTKEIAEFVFNFKYDQIPGQAVQLIKNAFLDTVGVGIAGSNEIGSKIIKDFISSEKAQPTSTIWGSKQKTSPSYSALVNGAMAHSLDFDDVNSAAQGHPSTVIVPAVMAVSEELNISGKIAILSYFVGFEVMAYAGKLLGYTHYKKGWHGTATLGVLGATAVAGKLYGLTVEQLEMALGIAVSHSCGTRQNFGTMTKPYHPGNAARSGIVAASLAKRGFSGNKEIIEAPLGFISLLGDRNEPATNEKIGEKFELIDSGINVKKYACCFATHRAADAVFEILKRSEINPDDIEEIIVKAPEGGFTPVIYSRPVDGLEGKFSVEYVIAAAITDRNITLDTFTDEAVQRKSVQALLKKVKKEEDQLISFNRSAIDEGFVELTIFLNNEKLTQKIEYPKGSPRWPLTQDELHNKFRDCVKNNLDVISISKVLDMFNHLEDQNNLIELYNLIQIIDCESEKECQV